MKTTRKYVKGGSSSATKKVNRKLDRADKLKEKADAAGRSGDVKKAVRLNEKAAKKTSKAMSLASYKRGGAKRK
jgi:alkanesulfonate monooxygenase SsuD/methylene tetrahydromethanopterin reductase-like flavin-dependent oxidoreductase (luciferase family)